MTTHCSTCSCKSDPIPQPSTASRWAIDQAKQAADEAVKAAKERRLAAAKGEK